LVKSNSIKEYKISGNQAIDILANIGDAIVCVDNNNIITYWNKKAEKLYNLKADEVIGQNLKSAYEYKWINPRDKKVSEASLKKEGRWEGENIHIKKNGQEIIVQSTVTVLKEEKRVGLLAVIRDITLQKINHR